MDLSSGIYHGNAGWSSGESSSNGHSKKGAKVDQDSRKLVAEIDVDFNVS